jgi:hypothetical protein
LQINYCIIFFFFYFFFFIFLYRRSVLLYLTIVYMKIEFRWCIIWKSFCFITIKLVRKNIIKSWQKVWYHTMKQSTIHEEKKKKKMNECILILSCIIHKSALYRLLKRNKKLDDLQWFFFFFFFCTSSSHHLHNGLRLFVIHYRVTSSYECIIIFSDSKTRTPYCTRYLPDPYKTCNVCLC